MEWNGRNSIEFWPGNLGEAGQSPRRLSQFVPHSGTCVFTLCSTSPLDYYYSQHTMSTSLVMLLCLWVCCQGVQWSWAIRKALYLPWLKRKQVIRQKRHRSIASAPSSTPVSLSLRLIVLVPYFDLSPTQPVNSYPCWAIARLYECRYAFGCRHCAPFSTSLQCVIKHFHNDSSLFGIVWSSGDDHCSPGYFIVSGYSSSWVRICIFCHNMRCEIDGKWERERGRESGCVGMNMYIDITSFYTTWLNE